MSFSLEQKQRALQLYDETKSVTKVITCLGYPTRQCLYHWLWMRKAPGINLEPLKNWEKVVRRLMAEEGLSVPVRLHKNYSSYQGEITPSVDNLINRDFHADVPNKKWLTDITEFSISAGKVYLSALVDCFDGMIVAWKLGTSPNANLVNSMLAGGIRQLNPGEHPIVHTDRGCHYRWPGWIECMETALLTRSMSRKGCSPDNSACEGFWGRLKNEMFYPGCWTETSIEDFMNEVDCYIRWYNQERIKESLGYLSPMEYRQKLGFIA